MNLHKVLPKSDEDWQTFYIISDQFYMMNLSLNKSGGTTDSPLTYSNIVCNDYLVVSFFNFFFFFFFIK